jgi:peptidoglycan-N-acetylglucosamine deacetylase
LLSVLIFVGVVVLGALYVFWVAPLWFLPVLEWLTPGVLFRVRTSEPLVGLSFDDGPHPDFTPRVLEILQKQGARATFFLIGERAARCPTLVDAIRAAGHELGNHCWRDGSIVGLTDEEFARSLEQTEQVLQRDALGTPISRLATKFFRAPGGVAWPRQWRLARGRGYLGVLGCAYPHDPMHPPIWYMRWLINKNLRPGTIVILHDGIQDPSRTVAALPAILERGCSRGFRFVTVGELITAAHQREDRR